ncbi:Nischarin [Dirofilaria immitis]|nr:Nischarin [Dirofilaria immitis]
MHTSIDIKRHNSRLLLYGHSIDCGSFIAPFGDDCYDDDNDDDDGSGSSIGKSREVHAVVEDLSLKLGSSGEKWLQSATKSQNILSDRKTDVANCVEFLHNVRNLKIRGARGYVGTSNIIWNSLPFGLNLCKNITALWISDFDVRMIHDLHSVRNTCKRVVIHYSMKKLSDFLLEPDELLPIKNQEKWASLEEIDFSFNELEQIDESISLLNFVKKMNLSHNLLTSIGDHLQHLTMLTELNLSHNAIENLDLWYTKLGNVKRLCLAGNKISSLDGLHKLYSLEFLDLTDNIVASPDDILTIGNPIRQVIEYRIKVLEYFGERAMEMKLDSKKPDQRETDTILVRLALRKAREEKEQIRKMTLGIDKRTKSLEDKNPPVRSL